MNRAAPDEAIDRLERQMGRLLQAGVWLASVCLAAGLVLWIAIGPGQAANAFLTGGLIVLMLTPLARVVVSFITLVRLRDWFFAGMTVLVFIVLVAAWLLKA
jgi:uncharacterized membrane protein